MNLTTAARHTTMPHMTVLDSLANHLARSPRWRHLFFLGATLLTIAITGYHVGTFDQAIHIPFLKKFADPALYPNDPFLDLRFQHYSYFWFLLLPFYRLGALEIAMFIAHVGATYLTFWALWTLSDQLFRNPLTSLFTLAAFCIPHIGFAAFTAFEFSLLNRTFVLPFLLWGIVLFLRGRYLAAFALVGLIYNLHALSANFVFAMFLFHMALSWRAIGWQKIAGSVALGVLCALPVLLWKFSTAPADFAVHAEWFDIIARGRFYHLFYLLAPYPHILIVTASGFSALTLFVIARRRNPSPAHDRTMTHFVCAMLIMLAVQAASTQWYPATIIIQLQVIRAGVFILIFGYLYCAHYIVARWQAGAATAGESGVLAVATVSGLFAFLPLIVWGLLHAAPAGRWRTPLAACGFGVLSVAAFLISLQYHVWDPTVSIYPRPSAWYEAQQCARTNTPTDARFITPPEKWWLYESDWRVYSERSTVATHSELLEAAFAPEYITYWRARFDDVAPSALDAFTGDYFANQHIVARAFYSLSADDFRRLSVRYGASYLVIEKPHAYDFPAVYENKGFVIYDVTTGGESAPHWNCPADAPVTLTSAPGG